MKQETTGKVEPTEHADSELVEPLARPTIGSKDDSLEHASPSTATDQPISKEEDNAQPAKQGLLQRLVPRALGNSGLWRRLAQYRTIRQDEMQLFSEEDDSQQNERGRLPDAEHVQVPAIWVAELYTASKSDGLHRGIASLGWEQGLTHDDSLLEWLHGARQGCHLSWTSLGLVSRSSRDHIMTERISQLPEGVQGALPVLMSLTPSVTALVIGFLLDDEAADALDAPLRAYYSSRSGRRRPGRLRHILSYILLDRPTRFSCTILFPDDQRRAAARSCIEELETGCIHWIRTNLPGVFASQLRDQAFPTAILTVTEKTAPASEESRSIRAFDGLSINSDFDAWESVEWPSGRLVFPRSRDEEDRRLTFACRRRDAFPDRPVVAGATSNWIIAQRADDQIRGLLSRWALTCLLNSYHEQLADLRDRSAAGKSYRPLRDLKKLRSMVRTMFYDIVASTREIQEFVDDDRFYRCEVQETNSVRSIKGKKTDLIEDFKFVQGKLARQVLQEADLLQSVLSTTTEVSHMITDILIQRWVMVMTIVSIGIAAMALFL